LNQKSLGTPRLDDSIVHKWLVSTLSCRNLQKGTKQTLHVSTERMKLVYTLRRNDRLNSFNNRKETTGNIFQCRKRTTHNNNLLLQRSWFVYVYSTISYSHQNACSNDFLMELPRDAQASCTDNWWRETRFFSGYSSLLNNSSQKSSGSSGQPWTPVTHRPDYGGSKRLWNVGKNLPDYTAQHPIIVIFMLVAARTWNLT
jgi:hypothetical protein